MADKLVCRDVALHINQQFETTNMVHILFRAEEEARGEQNIVISCGDVVYEAPVLEKLLRWESEVCVVSD